MTDMRMSAGDSGTDEPRHPVPPDFRSLFEATPGVYLVLAADPPRFSVLAASDERLVGATKASAGSRGPGVFEVFAEASPDYARRTGVESLRESLDTVLSTRAPHNMAIQRNDLARPDGTWEQRYWKPVNSPVLGPRGEVRYIIHHVEDVTPEVAAEALAAASDAERASLVAELTAERVRLDAVLRQLPVGVVLADASTGKLVLGNDQIARLWGHPEPAPGKVAPYADYSGFHPASGTLYPAHEWPLARAVSRGETVRGEEIDFIRGDGTRGTMSVTAAPVFDPEGHLIAGVAVFEDVTERNRAAADRAFLLELADALQGPGDADDVTAEATRRLAEHLGCLGCAFADVDAVRRVLCVRPGYVRAGGITPSAEYAFSSLGRDWQAQMESGLPYLVEDAAAHERTVGGPYDLHHAPMGARSLLILPLIRAGRWTATLGVWHDQPHQWTDRELTLVREVAARVWPALDNARLLTEARDARAEAEQRAHDLEDSNMELVRLAAEAEGANRAKSDFLAVMSHELRTPLNAILGYVRIVEMGLHGPVTEGQRESLGKIVKNQARLLSLITDVLDYAKLESGQLRLTPKNVALSVVIEGVETAILPQANAKGISYDCCSGCDALGVRADPERVQQILLNLLSNAVKFSSPGGSIEVRCEAVDRRVAIYVRDTGCGIPAEKLDVVFEPFVQIDPTLRRTQEGVGLGLAISRDLARVMGGDLTAESVEGVGSTFTLVLPRAG